MTGKLFMEALTDIDDRFIVAAADTENIKSLFENINDAQLLEEKNKPKKAIKFKHILLIAIISILLLAVAVSVSGYISNYTIDQKLIRVHDTYLELFMHDVENKAEAYSLLDTDLAKELEANGISPVTFPSAFLTDGWEIEEIIYDKTNENSTSASILFIKDDMKASLCITQYTDEGFLGTPKINQPRKGTQLQVNGMNIYVFSLIRSRYSTYCDGLTIYSFSSVDCKYEDFIKIAETIQ